MTTKEMIKIMKHYENGGEVELKQKYNSTMEWEICTPLWNWVDFDYRIKEQKQKVTIEKWLCKNNQGEFIVIETSNIEEWISLEKVKLLESYEIEL